MASNDSTGRPELSDPHHFWIRRLHSLAGVIPLGVFLTIHLMTNASVLGGEQMFDRNVGRIHALGPLLYPVEVIGIFIPLAFHLIVGIKIVTTARYNHRVYAYTANKRYTWQRVTGVIAALFVVFHVVHMHWLGKPLSFLGGGQFDPDLPTQSAAAALQASPILPILYAAGVICTVYHFANGLWTSMITWGITVGQRAQRISGRICLAIGLGLGALGLGAVVGFQTFVSGINMPMTPHRADSAPQDRPAVADPVPDEAQRSDDRTELDPYSNSRTLTGGR
jgi:succinate dehydrogenase / fumarate reductase cytochrome b subunit